tara:strand:+ start:430 stop:726 length:297 start_codon:yes stop_codon:yes gene_type:complete
MFLIKLDGEKEDFYLCSSSDWTTVVIAENKNEAANKALTYIIDELGLGANVAAVIRVKKINEEVEISDDLFRMDEMLSDIGMYKESQALKELLNNDRD